MAQIILEQPSSWHNNRGVYSVAWKPLQWVSDAFRYGMFVLSEQDKSARPIARREFALSDLRQLFHGRTRSAGAGEEPAPSGCGSETNGRAGESASASSCRFAVVGRHTSRWGFQSCSLGTAC